MRDQYKLMNTDQQDIPMMQAGEDRAVSGRDRVCTCAVLKSPGAAIIVNADDWGRDIATTERSLECVQRGTVSSVSAMVFMEDSERAAALARLHGVDAGLHLNFTLACSAASCPTRLREHQGRLARFLGSHWLAPALYHPGLVASFEYVVKQQLDEYERLFAVPAGRVDGHHHMHLCMNVTRQKLLPEGVIVRRNLSFRRGEKGYLNRAYRRLQDQRLAQRHRQTDYFFDLKPIEPRRRLSEILKLADRFDIEVETHPIRDEEYRFLVNGDLLRCGGDVAVSRGYILRYCKSTYGFGNTTLTRQSLR
jgi:predicted glycoside hydrolase/deacetylase ChbG (UPF0249 family)